MKAEKFEPGWLERDVKSAAQRSKELLPPSPASEAVWDEAIEAAARISAHHYPSVAERVAAIRSLKRSGPKSKEG